ncbi:type II secretion system protein [Burkholderia gladioli]
MATRLSIPAARRAGKRRGFTLIELLLVLSITALMLTIALPQYFHSIDASKEKILAENLHATRDAIDQFYGDLGRYPDSLQELVDRHYLRTLPFDPVADNATSWQIIAPEEQFPGKVYDLKSGAQGSTLDGRPFDSL